jgi:hypothetical protein
MLTAALAYFVSDSLYGISVFWGGVVALANSVLLLWRMRPELKPSVDPQRHLIKMYRSSLERFFVVTMLLAMGMVRLIPLAVLLGFVVSQMALVVVPLIRGLKVK